MKIERFEFQSKLYLILDNFLKYTIPIFYFLVAVMFYLRTYDSCQIKITITQIGGTVIILLWFIKLLENLKEAKSFYFNNWQIVVPFVLFLLSGLQSHLFMSPLKKASGMELIRRVIYMFSVIIIMKEINSIEKFKRVIKWLLAALFISTFYGIIQFLDIKYFPPNPAVGLDPFIWRQAFGNRVFSTFGNPNFYGDFLVAIAPICLALFIYHKKIFFLILWLMTLFNTYVTYSKGAWIGFVAGFIYFCYLYIIFFLHTKAQKIRLYVFIASIIALVITSWGVYFQLTQRTDSAKFRIYTWLSCWEMINTSPVLGTGIGTFYVTYPAWRRPQIFYIEGKHNTESDHPENEYLEVWYDEGTVGFGIFLFIIVLLVVTSIKALKRFSEEVAILDKKGKKKIISQDIRAFYLLGFLSGWLGSLTHNWVCVSMRFVSSGTVVWMMAGLISSLIVNNPLPERSKEENVVSYYFALFIICLFWFFNFIWWKMTFDVSLVVSIVLFILGIIIEGSPLKPVNLKVPFSGNRLTVKVIQVVGVLISIYLMSIFRGYFIGDIHHNIAIFFSKQGNWSEALTNYNIVAKNNPGFVMCHYFMGNVFNDRWSLNREFRPEWGDKETDKPIVELDLNKQGRIDPERAIAKYQDVWKLAPNYVQSHHQAGVVYMKLGLHFKDIDMQKSIYYFNKALEYFWKYHKIDPIFPVNYQRMASIYLNLGNLEMAEKVFKGHLFTQWLCQNPKDIINPKKIKTQEEKIKYEELLQKFEEEKNWICCDYHKRQHYLLSTEDWAKRRANEYSDSYLQLGRLYLNRNNEEAEKFFIRAIKTYPQNFIAWKSLIALYQQLNRTDKIEQTIKWYLQEFPQDKELSNLKS
ncbi:MAG: O-antigen ligase family protein [Elusimicrobiota bacterium]|nr:O-antigen ligase family protein [Endomicrobiia bacterium]MDW8165188.1 O-antigen ligase family protein [Elusimicrobiota bacterium]